MICLYIMFAESFMRFSESQCVGHKVLNVPFFPNSETSSSENLQEKKTPFTNFFAWSVSITKT